MQRFYSPRQTFLRHVVSCGCPAASCDAKLSKRKYHATGEFVKTGGDLVDAGDKKGCSEAGFCELPSI